MHAGGRSSALSDRERAPPLPCLPASRYFRSASTSCLGLLEGAPLPGQGTARKQHRAAVEALEKALAQRNAI